MKNIFSVFWKWLKRIVAAFFILSIVSTILFRFIPVPITPLMLIRCVEQIADGELPTLKKDWVPLSEINSSLVLAVIASEDQKFAEHFGFDFEAIEKVAKQNIKLQKRGKPIKGGSTISQQCAKNVYLFPQRSYIRKAFEVYFTFLIEVFWSKKRIMEVYLNVIEMGNGIYGAQAAAKTFFKKDAKQLSNAESATIAAVLPNPRRWNAGKPTGYINKRKNWILRQMSHLRGSIQL
ncbi:MAG TPA: monofunctional biosynthetic peptidoglycan transglycosylase [Chitinophagales bacterium]|nr:monofunctional biosynthetic peptidoglycan transglycosylase [Chitinophagales bacterium]HMW11545.1 monofunctional biosynthetic peptidoglycan transglycosylase [Chitinophagales bacterium]HMX59237.1 monofunctional biosynthetic peptidoglycan transglycosylase [Chitinophagales bacterium]HMY23502.1 monofunctional biosynthetic peptidoglycan transglycosylase [Chitinophagales bacterium]HMZ32580.1 monofunctional biosynthetic peptidoglycan transglycosylase [Chitinophagales bacterium]